MADTDFDFNFDSARPSGLRVGALLHGVGVMDTYVNDDVTVTVSVRQGHGRRTSVAVDRPDNGLDGRQAAVGAAILALVREYLECVPLPVREVGDGQESI